MPRKRTYEEMSLASASPAPASKVNDDDKLTKLRNMWEFACLVEWIGLFGPAVKIPSIDIEEFELECVKPQPSQTLEDFGFRLVNWISSRRDITIDNWDEHVRRQYIYKSPHLPHPYGAGEEPAAFRSFHIMTKIRVLHQLTVWTFWNPDRLRQAFPDVKEAEQFDYWQMHPVGWDREERTYFYLTGDRLYRRTDPPVPTDKPKTKYTSKKAQSQRRKSRTSKRRKVGTTEDDIEHENGDTEMAEAGDDMDETVNDDTVIVHSVDQQDPATINTFGTYKWECIAVSLDEYNSFLTQLGKTKDPNEANLKAFVQSEALAALEAQDAKRQRKIQAQLREIQMAEKVQGAKRSGRLAAKQEREREDAELAEAERKRQATLVEARREQERAEKMDYERQSRMMTRDQRIKEREMKRVLMEDQLARDAEAVQGAEEGLVRATRHLKDRVEKTKQELGLYEDDDWTFDCSGCHQYGKNFDDGEHSVACERCNVWQHSKCLGVSKTAAERDDFHFVCKDCRRKEEEANRPKISLKFKVGQSSSPPQPTSTALVPRGSASPPRQKFVSVDVPPLSPSSANRPSAPGVVIDGQFFPTPGPIHSSKHSLPQPQPNAIQPTMPAYAMKQAQKSQTSAVPPTYPVLAQYAPHNRLPGSEYAQDLYSQITFQNNGMPHFPPQHVHTTPQLPALPTFRPSSSHAQTPRPRSSHSQMNGHSSPVRQRIASPILNPPTMSPTQGNHDVGPIAGIPGSSPILQPASTAVTTTYTNGYHSNGSLVHRTPAQQPLSRDPSFSSDLQGSTQPVSGLSPTKQRTSVSPVPPSSVIPQKQNPYTTPSSSFNQRHAGRSVSGTPIFPLAHDLAPSPQQLNREPVPTPSKHSPPPPPSQPQLQSFSSNVSHVSATPTPSQTITNLSNERK